MNSTDIILHHFDASPFAEKVRLALGLKGLSWRSVEIPMVMPKPMLTALTGGYRKTPVMQIGADIYCDTQGIALELERRFPQPTLFPDNSEALAMVLSHWSDNAFFRPGAALSMATNAGLPEDVLRDREAFFTFLDFDSMHARIPHFFAQFRAQLQLLESMLEDGRSYLLGDRPGWVDVLAYFPLWMARGNIAATAELVAPLQVLQDWEARMQSLGHGHCQTVSAEDALQCAANSISRSTAWVESSAWSADLQAGAEVIVTPEDYGAVPVEGTLLRLSQRDIAIQRKENALGEITVHFPRTGYEVKKK
ncbi:MAG: glutathione S-transferase family protein [Congregibacter sp.]